MECRYKVLVCLRTEFPGLKDYWEEIVQEALERTLRVWIEGGIKPGVSPLPYMKKVARNLAYDSFRVPEQPMDDNDLLPLVEARGARLHEVITPIDLAAEVVIPAVANMKPSKRKTVAEAQIQGQDVDSIAADLRVPPQQVRSLSSKAAGDLIGMDEVRTYIRPAHQKKFRRGEYDAGGLT
ncbi:RNA polymerase sigma factor [Streptomyces zaomyceticus]|uniref:RNA polymerase sigma factor n=1 Tax=Streptomyces zaomyceticus TaxID=68286 RepID=UPI0037114A56